jgi:glucosamine kinase
MFFLAIDGGGTKTTCLVADDARVLGRAISGPSNIVRVGEAAARKSIHAAIQAACEQAGVTPQGIERVCVGAAGSGRETVRQAILGIVAELVPGHAQVVADMEIALEAGVCGGAGVVVIAGTGSVAYGRNPQGETARAGGWGWAVSDEGSAHWIGRRAVSAALRAADHGHEAALLRAIMNCWHIDTIAQFVETANSVPPPDFAQLFPEVVSACRQGDVLARVILADAASELAELAGIVIGRLWPTEAPVRVVLCGGVFQHSAEVRLTFSDALRTARSSVCPDEGTVDPLDGALWLVRKCAG